MKQEELDEILRRHKAWMTGEDGGERADLHDVDLQRAGLQQTDLRCANLQNTKLHRAKLQHAKLQSAELQHTVLQHTDLHGADLQNAKLRSAVLQHTDLRCTDLLGADLQYADMRGADIDYASWPLWCGSLEAHVDDRIAIQLLYHTLSVVQHSPYVSEDVKAKLLTPEIISLANRFHRALECGEIKEWEEGTK